MPLIEQVSIDLEELERLRKCEKTLRFIHAAANAVEKCGVGTMDTKAVQSFCREALEP